MTAVYHWDRMGDTLPKYERRTTICSAVDEEAATEVLLREAREYPDGEQIVFLEEYDIELIGEELSEEPIEVAFEMTIGVDPTSGATIEPDRFLEQYWFASKIESCDVLGFKHIWNNIDNLTSGCYNCKVVRKGRLWEQSPETEK